MTDTCNLCGAPLGEKSGILRGPHGTELRTCEFLGDYETPEFLKPRCQWMRAFDPQAKAAFEEESRKAGELLKRIRARMEGRVGDYAPDFGSFLAGFSEKRPEWFKGAATQVLEARKTDPARQAVVQAAPADFKSAAAGEDSEVVEDGYHGIE